MIGESKPSERIKQMMGKDQGVESAIAHIVFYLDEQWEEKQREIKERWDEEVEDALKNGKSYSSAKELFGEHPEKEEGLKIHHTCRHSYQHDFCCGECIKINFISRSQVLQLIEEMKKLADHEGLSAWYTLSDLSEKIKTI